MQQVREPPSQMHFATWALFSITMSLLVWGIVSSANFIDFSAFSCAGQALRLHQDPYMKSSLEMCEATIQKYAFLKSNNINVNIFPAPFPPYAIAFFSLFSLLDPLSDISLWMILISISSVFIIKELYSMTGLPLNTILSAVSILLVSEPISNGQITPLIFGAYMLMLRCASRKNAYGAVSAALVTMLEPHLGLAVCIGLFISMPSSRRMLIIGAFALVVVTLSVMPISQISEYFKVILPQHALSEIHRDAQYSLAHLLVSLGVGEHFAIVCSSLQYGIMMVFGAFITWKMKRRGCDCRIILLAVPMCAMLGGPFLHLQQLFIANIAALMLYGSTHKMFQKNILLCLLLVLALPMEAVLGRYSIILYGSIAASLVFPLRRSMKFVFWAVISMTCLASLSYDLIYSKMFVAVQHGLTFDSHHLLMLKEHTNNLEAYWRAYSDTYFSSQGVDSLILQAPTLIAYAVVLAMLVKISIFDENIPSMSDVTA